MSPQELYSPNSIDIWKSAKLKSLQRSALRGSIWFINLAQISVALATESSVYVWSRAPVVKLHKTLNNESG